MKIGILTLPLTNNYGGIIQAYALQSFLKKLGHDVTFVDRRYNKPSIKSQAKILIHEFLYNEFHVTVKQSELPFNYFINTYLSPKTESINSENNLSEVLQNFNAVIVGSDQVWRLEYAHNIYKNLFLKFSEEIKIKRIAYAASFGVEEWRNPELRSEISSYLKKFDSISVREDSGVVICNSVFDVHAEHLLDPTSLLTTEDYVSLINNENDEKWEGDLLTYVLDENKEKQIIIDTVSKITKLKMFSVAGENVDFNNYKNFKGYKKTTVTKWLKGFNDAKFIVTDSFHGTIFSIIFNKPFIVIGNKERGLARFQSLLRIFNLEDRLIFSAVEVTEKMVNDQIDFTKVNQVLTYQRTKSFDFLKDALK